MYRSSWAAPASARLLHLSTGDLLRAAVTAGTPLGQNVKMSLAAGLLVSDELVIDLVREKIATVGERGIIFDGFPRTVAQAQALDTALAETGRRIDRAIVFEIDGAILFGRVQHRARQDVASGKTPRPDDHPEILLRRFRDYESIKEPILAYYARKGSLAAIDAQQSEEVVALQIMQVLNVTKASLDA
jgi:adenylate kinase